ncbi:hypothetical protein F4678DRAFT_258134 [Xylaria arbuscula]|nr:hypothetical protein F4678DRAFT_258134 [Xylaria arbuscula]
MEPLHEKSIQIEFTQEQVEYFNSNGFKLCCSAGMANSESFNVIAKSQFVAPFVNISWEDRYTIAGSNTVFQPGVQIRINTAPTPIQKDETYTLPVTWQNGEVEPEQHPSSGFMMVNQTTDRASAIVFKIVDGEPAPFYISAVPIQPGSSELITPKSTVNLWFEKYAETGTMVSKNPTNSSVFDFRGVTAKTLHYDECEFKEGEVSHH